MGVPMMHSRSLCSHLWRRIVNRLMRSTFGYDNDDVNVWREQGHKLAAQLEHYYNKRFESGGLRIVRATTSPQPGPK